MRWIIRLAITAVTLVILVVLGLFMIPSEKIAGLATRQFEQATGRALQINGEVRPTVFPQIGVQVGQVSLANAPWSDQGPMVQAERLRVGVDFMALLGGAVQIETLEIVDPVIVLERNAQGAGNWEFSGPAPAEAGSVAVEAQPDGSVEASAPPKISVRLAEITNGSLTWIDHAAGSVQRVQALDLQASLPDFAGTVTAKGSAAYNGAAIVFDASVEGLEGLLAGALTPVRADVKIGGTGAVLAGQASLSPVGFVGRIDADVGERAQVFAALGQTPPALPRGLGRERITLGADLTLASEGSVHLRNMALGLDGNRIDGAVDVFTSGARPKIVANLKAGALDFTGLSQQGGGNAGASGEAGEASAAGWSTAPIDVSGLFAVDAEITAATGAIRLGDASLDSVNATITLDNGRAVLGLKPIALYGGQIAGDIIVNGRGGLSSRVNVALSNMQMQPFLTEFIDYDRLVGTADMRVNVLGSGRSLDALMKSLEGDGALSIGKGELLGLDLAGMLRNLDTSYRGEGSKTIFDGVTASFAIAGGVLRNSDLNFVAPLLTATGEGEIGIGAQTLNYRVVPVALRGTASESGIRVPVLITGTWRDPKFRPDLEFLFDERLEAEKAALEARAREEADAARARAEEAARRKLAEELEVDPDTLTDGGSVEDAVKKRLEDELRGALGGLLGGN